MSNCTNLTLNALIKNIVDASTIQDILATYDAQLKAAQQYEVTVIFPILTTEMQAVDSTYIQSVSSLTKFHQSIEVFTVLAKDTTAGYAAIYSLMHAADFNTQIFTQAKKLNDLYLAFYSSAQDLRNLTNDELIEATVKVAIPEIKLMHETINSTITDGTHSDDWVTSQAKKFSNELHGDVRSLSTDLLRKQMSIFYLELNQIVTSTVELYNLILRNKSINPMISIELFDMLTTLNQNAAKLDAMYIRSMNLIYIHSDDLLAVNNTVLVYQTLTKLLKKQK